MSAATTAVCYRATIHTATLGTGHVSAHPPVSKFPRRRRSRAVQVAAVLCAYALVGVLAVAHARTAEPTIVIHATPVVEIAAE